MHDTNDVRQRWRSNSLSQSQNIQTTTKPECKDFTWGAIDFNFAQMPSRLIYSESSMRFSYFTYVIRNKNGAKTNHTFVLSLVRLVENYCAYTASKALFDLYVSQKWQFCYCKCVEFFTGFCFDCESQRFKCFHHNYDLSRFYVSIKGCCKFYWPFITFSSMFYIFC